MGCSQEDGGGGVIKPPGRVEKSVRAFFFSLAPPFLDPARRNISIYTFSTQSNPFFPQYPPNHAPAKCIQTVLAKLSAAKVFLLLSPWTYLLVALFASLLWRPGECFSRCCFFLSSSTSPLLTSRKNVVCAGSGDGISLSKGKERKKYNRPASGQLNTVSGDEKLFDPLSRLFPQP